MADPYQWSAGVSKFLRLRVEGGSPDQLFYYAPEDLTARTVRLPFGLELRWSDRSNAEIACRVERQRLTDGVWDLFAITVQDTISYFDYTVQSGVAYAYRVRAMFPSGGFSAWTESGMVNPGGGGPGGPSGGDPDPDTDRDTFKDSVDAYPHDKRRGPWIRTKSDAEFGYKPYSDGCDIDKMVATECMWRYVGTKDTVVVFNSLDELTKDIIYRQELCKIARGQNIPAFGPSNRANKTFWKMDGS